MSKQLEALSPSQHANHVWIRSQDYRYAANHQFYPLVGAEFGKACLAFPIAFLQDDGRFFPIALLGLNKEHNLFVNSQGQWLGDYIPAQLRTHPFELALSADRKTLLCFDAASELVRPEAAARGERFTRIFDRDGQLAPELKQLVSFYEQIQTNKELTYAACKRLVDYDLLAPWELQAWDRVNQTPYTLSGLYRVDEKALEDLPLEQLADLKNKGVLTFIYSHLISTHLVERLEKLHEQHEKERVQNEQTANINLDQLFGEEEDDLFKF